MACSPRYRIQVNKHEKKVNEYDNNPFPLIGKIIAIIIVAIALIIGRIIM